MEAEAVPAQVEHVTRIAANVRDADRVELWAYARVTPEQAIVTSMRQGLAYASIVDGEPVALFGVVPQPDGDAVPWLVGTNAMARMKVQRALLAISKPMVDGWSKQYPLLFNCVDVRNTAAHRWLRWLGFTLQDAAPLGVDGELFYPFYRARLQ